MSILKELWNNLCSFVGNNSGTESAPKPDLENLKLVELKAVAKDRGLKGYSQLRKADLVRLLEASQ